MKVLKWVYLFLLATSPIYAVDCDFIHSLNDKLSYFCCKKGIDAGDVCSTFSTAEKENPFYLELNMKPVEGDVILLNVDLAIRLGLLSEKDKSDKEKLRELEKKIVSRFSYVIGLNNEATRTDPHGIARRIGSDSTRDSVKMIATYYQDLAKKLDRLPR